MRHFFHFSRLMVSCSWHLSLLAEFSRKADKQKTFGSTPAVIPSSLYSRRAADACDALRLTFLASCLPHCEDATEAKLRCTAVGLQSHFYQPFMHRLRSCRTPAAPRLLPIPAKAHARETRLIRCSYKDEKKKGNVMVQGTVSLPQRRDTAMTKDSSRFC